MSATDVISEIVHEIQDAIEDLDRYRDPIFLYARGEITLATSILEGCKRSLEAWRMRPGYDPPPPSVIDEINKHHRELIARRDLDEPITREEFHYLMGGLSRSIGEIQKIADDLLRKSKRSRRSRPDDVDTEDNK